MGEHMVEDKVVTRYAPSPTGNPHVGNIRTALFSYLLAKHNNGKFLLRIEDTDKSREVPGAFENILDSLRWLGIKPDNIYIQSNRLLIYNLYVNDLLDFDFAYKLDGAIWFKIPKHDGIVTINDLLHGDIKFNLEKEKDFVIIKSDGFPTYHFASVIDDHLMDISHVIRGEEWLSSLPKHISLYNAFSWEPPKFVHLPNILGSDKQKLSKRNGDTALLDYRDKGYLSKTIVNFLSLLGWAYDDKTEFFTLNELIENFDLDKLNKSPAIFNLEKLNWMNKKYIKDLSLDDLTRHLFNQAPGYPIEYNDLFFSVVELERDRLTTINFKEFWDNTNYFFIDPPKNDNLNKSILVAVKDYFTKYPEFDAIIEIGLRDIAARMGLTNKEFFGTLRYALTGSNKTLPIVEIIKVLGIPETIRRIEKQL